MSSSLLMICEMKSKNDLGNPLQKSTDPKGDPIQPYTGYDWAVTKASNTSLRLENGKSIVLQAAEIVKRRESKEGAILVETPTYQG